MARKDDDLKARIVAIRKTIRPLKAGSEHETWPEALSRFQQFVSGDIDAFIDEDSGELTIINLAQETGTPGYIFESAESAERMKHYAAEYDFPLPTDLIELMCGHGCFKMPAGKSREYASLYTTWKNSGDGGGHPGGRGLRIVQRSGTAVSLGGAVRTPPQGAGRSRGERQPRRCDAAPRVGWQGTTFVAGNQSELLDAIEHGFELMTPASPVGRIIESS